ncbi:MAG: hypothetical protein LUG49_05840 [Oscillospiraceae bacterium]|nr:hypothetical protein [Oscillospiraceae bacterium]
MMEKPIWWDYAIFYPYDDEPDYDGIHDGEIKGLRDDAPEEVKEEFNRDMELEHNGIKL